MIKNQRRVFRGRGGPTDRRLPKHNARRRKHHSPRQPKDEGEEEESNLCQEHVVLGETPLPELCELDLNDTESEQWDLAVGLDEIFTGDDEHRRPNSNLVAADTAERQGGGCQAEIDHLLQRIKNNQQSMQLSKSLDIPANYQKHVLNAVHNTALEWKFLLTYYSNDDSANKDIILQQQTIVGSLLFQLVQQALQCGPLSGSKAGYMKRCGSDVAQLVLAFLETTFPNRHECMALGWTEKQAESIDRWRRNARAAAEKEQSPSKSVLKKQLQSARQRKT
jgi:hypothetical protein